MIHVCTEGRRFRSKFRYDPEQPPAGSTYMRRFRVIVTIGVLLAFSAPAHAQDLVLSRLPSYFEALRSQAGIPALAATIISPDEVIWEQSFGFQDLDRLIAARPETPFHL